MSHTGLSQIQDELAPEVARAADGNGLLEALVPAAIGAVALGVLLSGDDDDRPRPNSSNPNQDIGSSSDTRRPGSDDPNRPR